MRLIVHPLIAGEGRTLFATTARRRGLELRNRERQAIESEITRAAVATIESRPPGRREARGYVVAGEGWHAGVIGIVASRLVERFHRPVVLIAGGDGKGQDFSPLAPAISAHARAVVLIGRAAPHIDNVLAGSGVLVLQARRRRQQKGGLEPLPAFSPAAVTRQHRPQGGQRQWFT